MKVRINQSVELGDVPESLHQLFEMLHEEATKISDSTRASLRAASVETGSALKYKLLLEMLQEVKTNLTEVDQTLVDVASILGGYINILEQPDEPAPTPVAPAPAKPKPDSYDDDLAGPDVPEYPRFPSPPDVVHKGET